MDLGTLQVPAGQAAVEACWVHSALNPALDLFERGGLDISWWKSVPVVWPADGDYFSWGAVNISRAHQWDVIGHELGHAIFHLGTSAVGSGGQHKIDECYTRTLAWSEGWASYFSAVMSQARDDEDAKFEFMVPGASTVIR